MASRLRLAVAQLGAKPGAREQLARLLDPDEVGAVEGDRWRRLDQRSWRTGAVAEPAPWQAAARAAGSVTVWRSAEDDTTGPGTARTLRCAAGPHLVVLCA